MMKRKNSALLAILLMISLCYNNHTIQAKDNSGFIAGACAIGAALFGIGAVVLADWYSSETDDQCIDRVKAAYQLIYSQYYDTMTYFGKVSGLYNYMSASYKPFHAIPELALYEFATHVWHQNSTQYHYRLNLIAAKDKLQSCIKDLRKRIHTLEGKSGKYEDQQRLRIMRKLLNDTEEFSFNITIFADCLEHHKTYFNLYDSVDAARARYIQEITIFESGRYSAPEEIKFYIASNERQYAFKHFVEEIEEDITALKSNIRILAYNYDKAREYAKGLVNVLVDIRNIVIADPRHQEELYQWEQMRLQRMHIEALQAQARAERERADAIHYQNMILNERNRIEQEKLWQSRRNNSCYSDVDVTVRFTV